MYRELPDPEDQVCYVLVGGIAFGRLAGSVFPGLSKPRVPAQMAGMLEQTPEWCHNQIKKS